MMCRPYSKPEGRSRESGMESGDCGMGSGLRKGVRQRSFFEDEYTTSTGVVGVGIEYGNVSIEHESLTSVHRFHKVHSPSAGLHVGQWSHSPCCPPSPL